LDERATLYNGVLVSVIGRVARSSKWAAVCGLKPSDYPQGVRAPHTGVSLLVVPVGGGGTPRWCFHGEQNELRRQDIHPSSCRRRRAPVFD